MHSTLFYCIRGVQDHIPESTPCFRIFCFLTLSVNFAKRRFVFKTRLFLLLHHQVSSPSAGYFVRWRDGKTKSYCSPSKRKQHIFKSLLCCAYWSQTWWCIQSCFKVYLGYKIKFLTGTHCLRLHVSENNQITLPWADLFFRQGCFCFSITKFLRHQLAIVFVEEMVERKVIVLPAKENSTFLKVVYAVHIDLKLDYAFYLVLLSTRVRRIFSRLDQIG